MGWCHEYAGHRAPEPCRSACGLRRRSGSDRAQRLPPGRGLGSGLERDLGGASPVPGHTTGRRFEGHVGHGVFHTVDDAITAAEKAFRDFQDVSLEGRKTMVAAMRAKMHQHRDELSRMAVEETGLGRYSDKLEKNKLAIDKTDSGFPVFQEIIQLAQDSNVSYTH